MRDKRHHRFCSAAGWPCPIGCQNWPASAAECFPRLPPEMTELLDKDLTDEEPTHE